MKFVGTFAGATLDLSTYQRHLKNFLVNELHKAAGNWLQAVAGSGGRVPLWSGMARASLLELSELISGRVILTPLKAKSRIPEGRKLGTVQQNIDKNSVTLIIETDVPHYNLQEYKKAPKGGSPTAPWFSVQAGIMKFREAIKDLHLPRPNYIIHRYRIK